MLIFQNFRITFYTAHLCETASHLKKDSIANVCLRTLGKFLEQSYYKAPANTQPAITGSKLIIETIEQGVKYFQS